MISNVSFASQYARVALNPNEKIRNMTAGRIAKATNDAFELASEDIGRTVEPLRPISGTSLKKLNPGAFDKNDRLTAKGQEGFDAIHAPVLGVTLDSKTHEYVSALRNHIAQIAYFEDDGKTASVGKHFDYFLK